jgi:hypothetical protein
MSYKIVLYKNGKRGKVLLKSNSLEDIKNNYLNMVKKNEVLIPKKIVNSVKLKSVTYELILLESKKVSKGDVVVRDRFNRIIRDREIEPGWLILERSNWKIEETFKVFRRKERLNCIQILKEVILPITTPKQICCVVNKLIIQDDDDNMDIIVCKNEYECGRLHDTLMDICKKFKLQSIIFFGKSGPHMKSLLYKKIEKVTGWSTDRVYRGCTRP